MKQFLFTPGAVIPKVRIDRPSAACTQFGEGPGLPWFADFSSAPGAVSHETHELSMAVFAVVVVAKTFCSAQCGRIEAGAVAPRAESPFGKDSAAAPGAGVCQTCCFVEAIALGAAPWAKLHGLGNGFVTIDAGSCDRQEFLISPDEVFASYSAPVCLGWSGGLDGQ